MGRAIAVEVTPAEEHVVLNTKEMPRGSLCNSGHAGFRTFDIYLNLPKFVAEEAHCRAHELPQKIIVEP